MNSISNRVSIRRVYRTWWPLAASWLLMGIEGPAVSAAMARLADPEIQLAAYGGVVFPLALIIEAPIIMLLSASTALAKDETAYRKVFRFMMITGFVLTVLHLVVAATPVYYAVVRGLLGVPEEIIEPARTGLILMTPWTWAVAYRRFQQGVLIRFGRSRAVGVGTLVRLAVAGLALIIGSRIGWSGIVVGTVAQSVSVIAEALFAGWRVQPVLRQEVFTRQSDDPFRWRSFFAFYVPLALMQVLTFLWNPIGSAAISRMANPLDSLAAWPVVTGLIFMLRSPGFAYNEVVVALLDEEGSSRSLQRFSIALAGGTSLLFFLVAATPLSEFWFRTVSALNPDLVAISTNGIWLALPIPFLTTAISWYQGTIVYGKRTGGIPEAVVVFLITALVVLGYGIWRGDITGLYVGIAALSLASFTQSMWLWFRSRPVIRQVQARDEVKLHAASDWPAPQ
ncbi:MAG TPA: hypothetical protein VFF68_11540 [Anaerolineaceae bacterium]|nr:hypothetical protein [Anaerolineaceae bacterium]